VFLSGMSRPENIYAFRVFKQLLRVDIEAPLIGTGSDSCNEGDRDPVILASPEDRIWNYSNRATSRVEVCVPSSFFAGDENDASCFDCFISRPALKTNQRTGSLLNKAIRVRGKRGIHSS
jgi:hypothetical protein